MTCQCRVLHKGFITEVTLEQSFFLVGSLVRRHQAFLWSSVRAIGIHAALEHIAPMDSHVRGQMVFVFGAEMTLGTMQTIDVIVHQLMGVKAAFVRKLFLAFVTMEYFAGVQNLVKLHPMYGSRGKSAARRRTVQKRTTIAANTVGDIGDFAGRDRCSVVTVGMAQQRAQF